MTFKRCLRLWITRTIKVVEPRDSKKDDLIGIADLVLGAVNYDLKKGQNPTRNSPL